MRDVEVLTSRTGRLFWRWNWAVREKDPFSKWKGSGVAITQAHAIRLARKEAKK